MAVNAFLTFFDQADGESIQRGKEKWVEVMGWDWEIEAEVRPPKGGGARVGKAKPGKLSWEHYFDTSSTTIMGFLCNGAAFPRVELQMTKATGSALPETYFSMLMQGAFITKVSNSGTEEGNVLQRCEMVFDVVTIDYQPSDPKTGALGSATTFNWDIPAGTASPSSR
jgi:type VI secretion system Hcp family effector